jgi:hypothetical protein
MAIFHPKVLTGYSCLMMSRIGIIEIFILALYLIFFAGGVLALYFIVKLAIKNAIKELKRDGTL